MFLDNKSESEFPINKEKVFDVMVSIIPSIHKMKLISYDKLQSRLRVKTGISSFSWGEEVLIQLIEINPTRTKIIISSTSNANTNSAFLNQVTKKSKENIEIILSNTSKALQAPDLETYLSELKLNNNDSKWFDNNFVIFLSCFFFLPLGLYCLYNTTKKSLTTKIIIGAIFCLFWIFKFFH